MTTSISIASSSETGISVLNAFQYGVSATQVGEYGVSVAIGFTGSSGAGAVAAYVHQQTTSAAVWTINHNLGVRPSVEVFDSGSQQVEADVSHPNVNTTSIMFAVPITGYARLT